MPYIEPVRPGEIRDPELQDLVERCERLGVPDYAKALLRAMLLSHAEGNVDTS